MSKMEVAMDMLRRGWKMGLHAKYVITDSWFTCEQLMTCVRSIGKGAMHFVGLAKMGKTKYTVSGRKKNAAELIATYERERGKNCRKYKCRYIQLNGHLGDIPVRIFLINYGRNSRMERPAIPPFKFACSLLPKEVITSFFSTNFCNFFINLSYYVIITLILR